MSDLISRQDAINAVGVNSWAGYRLKKVPSAERKGEWLEYSGYWYITQYRCSECGKVMSNMSNYCPDCGARMVSEDDR